VNKNIKDALLVPININYENVLEVDSLLNEWFGRTKKKENLAMFIRSLSILRQNFGDLIVQVGKPLSLKEFYDSHIDTDFDLNLIAIGELITDRLQESTSIMNSSLISIIFLTYKTDFLLPKFLKLVSLLNKTITNLGGTVNLNSNDESIIRSLSSFGFFEIDQSKNLLIFKNKQDLNNLFKLMYYKNISLYLFMKDAIILIILHMAAKKGVKYMSLDDLKVEFDFFSRYFKEETYKIDDFPNGIGSYVTENKLGIYNFSDSKVNLTDFYSRAN
jgi:glycerol-3-phosphate O-acyltransferase